jgi:glycosyltransferase involved in cell wall biosynthesis
MQPSISVALASRNGARFIELQLRSILTQTVRPDQLVVSDDASTDETLQIVEAVFAEFEGSGVRTSIIRNAEPLGVRANFEQAMLACSGDIIALSDQDDVWESTRVERVTARFRGEPELLLLFSDARLVDSRGRYLGHTLFEALGVTAADLRKVEEQRGFELLLRRNIVTGATVVVRRSVLARAVPFPAPWVHDEWLAIIAAVLGRIDVYPVPLVDYRQHGGNEIGVERLGLRGKIGRVIEPRDDRYPYLVERAEVLRDRLEELGDRVWEERLERSEEKVRHLRVREALPDARRARVKAVLREARTGRYALYSRGKADILRDLLQPAGVVRGPRRAE